MEITIEKLRSLNTNSKIILHQIRKHSKASEVYVDVSIIQDDGFTWVGSIPFFYRRTGLFIETHEELIQYLNEIIPKFTRSNILNFQQKEQERWNKEMAGKATTKSFFDTLLNLRWNSVKYDLPKNPNWARRIQDIKEFGYTIATDTKKIVEGKKESDTHIMLIPIDKGGVTGYEVMSDTFKKKAISVLKAINVYEDSRSNKHGLIPDHKFPEIRWDEKTKDHNPEEMSPEEIENKFQLLDNQRNQQKREVCRKCFQTGIRGTIYGINYFYQGEKNWPNNIPKTGKDAETGCVGCGWYDIKAWKNSLNDRINRRL